VKISDWFYVSIFPLNFSHSLFFEVLPETEVGDQAEGKDRVKELVFVLLEKSIAKSSISYEGDET
jgi:hypothetical protein